MIIPGQFGFNYPGNRYRLLRASGLKLKIYSKLSELFINAKHYTHFQIKIIFKNLLTGSLS